MYIIPSCPGLCPQAPYNTSGSLFYCGSNPLLIVIDCGCCTSVGFGNAYNTVVYTVSIGGYAVCPVGDSDKIVICVISICDSSVIGVDNLGKIAHCVILIANDLAVGVGIARHTVESIVGSGDRAVAVGYGQYVAVGIVSIAYSAFWRSIARDSAHGVIEI